MILKKLSSINGFFLFLEQKLFSVSKLLFKNFYSENLKTFNFNYAFNLFFIYTIISLYLLKFIFYF